jgi:hypothetical protein
MTQDSHSEGSRFDHDVQCQALVLMLLEHKILLQKKDHVFMSCSTCL